MVQEPSLPTSKFGPWPLRVAAALTAISLASCAGDEAGDSREAQPASASRAEPSPQAFDAEEAERLKALGYVDTAGALTEAEGVGVLLDEEGSASGLTLVTDALNCRTSIYGSEGESLREWSFAPCYRWGNSVLLPNGDLLLVGRTPHEDTPEAAHAARYVMRMSWAGEVLWRKTMPAHHDIELTPDGRIATLFYQLRQIDEVSPTIPTRDHSVAVLDAQGELLEEVTFWDLLNSNPAAFKLQDVKPRDFDGGREIDLFHSNAIEWMRSPELAGENPLYDLDNFLLCVRHQDSVVIVDWSEKKVVWGWGQGQISGPHDATLLANGNVLLFDNGLGRHWSRVIEVDPRTNEIVWEFRAQDPQSFYTPTRGANQRLSNGNTLITESDDAIVFEVDPEGREVWRFRNPNLSKRRQPGVLVRARRFEGMGIEQLEQLARDNAIPALD